MRYLPIFIAFLIFCLPLSKAAALDVTFKQKAEITDNHIVLADIATFSDQSALAQALATQIVGTSPEPGESFQLISETVIRTILRIHPVPRSTRWLGSATVQISRQGIQIEAGDILGAIKNYLIQERERLPKAEFSFEPKSLPLPFYVPKGHLEWEIVPSDPDIIGSGRFSVMIHVDGRIRKNMSIGGRLTGLAPVAVATDDLRQGDILTPSSVTMATHDICQLSDPVTSLRDILGKRLKHAVRKGGIIENELVEHPPMVLKGQVVKIVVSKGALFLTATGVARSNGQLNDVIRVINLSSRKLIFCKVTAPGIVEVTI